MKRDKIWGALLREHPAKRALQSKQCLIEWAKKLKFSGKISMKDATWQSLRMRHWGAPIPKRAPKNFKILTT